ncbi:MAG: hypothetical protein ACRC6U_05945, partial [Fusobacteriaceae bacterium]
MRLTLEERMAQKLEARKKNEVPVISCVAENKKKVSVINKNFVEKIFFTENEELDKYLHEKSIELLETQAQASIELGKIFTEVQEKIEEGTYSAWLDFNGFSRATAIRHKRRYNLFEKLKEDKKTMASHLTVRELEHIYKIDENRYLDLINDGATLFEIKKVIQNEKIIEAPRELQEYPEKEILYKLNILNQLNEEKLRKIDMEKRLKI